MEIKKFTTEEIAKLKRNRDYTKKILDKCEEKEGKLYIVDFKNKKLISVDSESEAA